MKSLLAVGFLCLSALASEPRSVSRISSLQIIEEGKYNVVCMNGNTEVATSKDIAANTVCGKPAAAMPISGMRAAIRKSEGMYETLCSNGVVENHSSNSILAGNPCFSVGKKIIGNMIPGTGRMLSADTLFFHPIEVTEGAKIMGWGFNTMQTKDPQVVVGIYSASDDGKPDYLVAQSEIFDVEAARLYLVGANGETLSPGKYFIAFAMNSALNVATRSYSTGKSAGKIAFPFTGKLPSKIDPYAYSAAAESYQPAVFAVGQ